MPLDRARLPDQSLMLLREWIKNEAPYDRPLQPGAQTLEKQQITAEDRRLWSIQTLTSPTIPTVQDRDWSHGPLDRFVLARLEAKGLTPEASSEPPPEADRPSAQ